MVNANPRLWCGAEKIAIRGKPARGVTEAALVIFEINARIAARARCRMLFSQALIQASQRVQWSENEIHHRTRADGYRYWLCAATSEYAPTGCINLHIDLPS